MHFRSYLGHQLGVSALVIGHLIGLLVAQPAWAAFDHVVTWSDMSAVDLRPAFQTGYATSSSMLEPVIPSSAFAIALRDADNRLAPEFAVSQEVMERTSFWLRVYTEFTTQQVAIFDSHHPELVYEVMDFRELARTARNAVVYEITMQYQKRKRMAEYRRAFDNLSRRERLTKRSKGRSPKLPALTALEERIIETRRALKHPHSFHEGARWLRAQTGQRDNIMKGLVAAEAFFPKMEAILGRMGVPPELTRLTLVESSFNLKANSKVGAAGVWQFMPKTGKQYMVINDHLRIDERRSPLKSTVAAAKLLKLHHKILGKNWTLAIISYNHGFRGLKEFMGRKVTQTEINKIFAPCSKKAKLGFASRNYYAEFLAILHAEAYRDLFYGEPPAPKLQSVEFVMAPRGKTAMQIAHERGIALEEFALLNPDIRDLRKVLPPRFRIAIPGGDDNLAGLIEVKPSVSKDPSS